MKQLVLYAGEFHNLFPSSDVVRVILSTITYKTVLVILETKTTWHVDGRIR
jgi:hypothetical protein